MYTLPELNYSYDALEPYIDARTMEIHHTKHHQGYIDKLNAVLEKHTELAEKDISKLLAEVETLPIDDADKKTIRNNGGGYVNHKLFWETMVPSNERNDQLADAITEQFGSIEAFKEEFNKSATTQFGSGWAWLVRDENNILQVYSTANQDSPYIHGHTPILALDVWEHAYYLNYQNKRHDYIEAWWNIVKII